MLEVRDGLWTVQFKGTLMAQTDTEKQLPFGMSWYDVEPKDIKSYLRWVEMDIHYVEAGQEGDDIRLPEGGYFYHVVHHTVCYHTHPPGCAWRGVPKAASTIDFDLLPCRECSPPMVWEQWPADPEDPELLCDESLLVDVEPVRHDLFREATAEGLVRRVEGRWLTMPASLLLEIAMQHELGADIAAVFRNKRRPA